MAQKGGEWEAVGHERENMGTQEWYREDRKKEGVKEENRKGRRGRNRRKKIIWTEGKRIKAKKKMRENIKLRNDRSADWH